MFLNLIRKYHLLSFDDSKQLDSHKKNSNINNKNKKKCLNKKENINFKNDNTKTTIVSPKPSLTELNETQLNDSKILDKKEYNKKKQKKINDFINHFNSFERLKKKYISLLTNNNLIKNKIKNCIYSPISTKKNSNLVISFYTNGFYDISEAPIYLSISIEFYLYLRNKQFKINDNDDNKNKLTSIPVFLDKIINTNLDKKIYNQLFHSSVALRRIEYGLKEKENYIEKHYNLKIIFLQRYWRYYFYNIINKKIILIQSVFRSFILRKKIFEIFLILFRPFLRELYGSMNKFLVRLKTIRNINKKKKKFRTFKSPKNKNISISIIEIPKENDISVEEEKIFENINEESNEYTKTNQNEYTKTNQNEYTKINNDELTKSNQDEFTKSKEEDFNKSKEEENNKLNQEDFNKSKEEENNKLIQEDFNKSKEEENNKLNQEEINKSKEEDINKSKEEEINKINNNEVYNNICNLKLNLKSSNESFNSSQINNSNSNKDYNSEIIYKYKSSELSNNNLDIMILKPVIHWEYYTKEIKNISIKEKEQSMNHIQINSELTDDAKWRIFILFLSNFFIQKIQRKIFNMIFTKNDKNKTFDSHSINDMKNNNDSNFKFDNLQFKEQYNLNLNERQNYNKNNIVLDTINKS